MYAWRVGPLVNLATYAGFGAGFLILLRFGEGERMPDDFGALPFVLAFACGVAALVALLFAHVLASIRPLADRPKLLMGAFQATSVALVDVPVFLLLVSDQGLLVAVPCALSLAAIIVAICRFVERRLPPYPARVRPTPQ